MRTVSRQSGQWVGPCSSPLPGLSWVYVLFGGQSEALHTSNSGSFFLLSPEEARALRSPQELRLLQEMGYLILIISLKQCCAVSTIVIEWIHEWWINEQSRQMSILHKCVNSHWLENNEEGQGVTLHSRRLRCLSQLISTFKEETMMMRTHPLTHWTQLCGAPTTFKALRGVINTPNSSAEESKRLLWASLATWVPQRCEQQGQKQVDSRDNELQAHRRFCPQLVCKDRRSWWIWC